MLNILNQLDKFLVNYLKKFMDLAEEEWIELRKFVQTLYLDLSGSNACLVSYAEEITENIKDKKKLRKSWFTLNFMKEKFRKNGCGTLIPRGCITKIRKHDSALLQ